MQMAAFDQPKAISDAEVAFGGRMSELLPAWNDIPEEFKRRQGTQWNRLQATWFFEGLKGYSFEAKDGIDLRIAMRHLAAIQGSFQPKHEHKEAGVAYLMSLWLKSAEKVAA